MENCEIMSKVEYNLGYQVLNFKINLLKKQCAFFKINFIYYIIINIFTFLKIFVSQSIRAWSDNNNLT